MKKKTKLSPHVQKYVDMHAKEVIDHWASMARVDVNEIIQYRRRCCRYCHGVGHEYQWIDESEWAAAAAAAMAMGKDPASGAGGYWFDHTRQPHDECPRCCGEGVGEVYCQDTNKLSPAARMLYNGVKVTKDGFEIKLRDRDSALVNIARANGMFLDRVALGGGKDGSEPFVIKVSTSDENI